MSRYDFHGSYKALGGSSFIERGGPGTVYYRAGNTTSLLIDNGGYKPQETYIRNPTEDSSRAYIVTDDLHLSELNIDSLEIKNGGHLAFADGKHQTVPVNIGKLVGDYSGMIHTSVNHPLHIKDSQSPFPASFGAYERTSITLPKGKSNS